jgi:hypothetical protein
MKKPFYFAQDAMQTNAIIKQFNDYKQPDKSQPEILYWAALVDSAFDYPVQDNAPYLHDGINCYSTHAFQALADAAPWLVPLQDDESSLKRVIRHCSERPMLSFIASTEPIYKLKEAWKDLHWVSDADGQPMVLRIADTRTLPSIATILSAQQWAALTAPLAHWLYVNREGQLKALVLAPKAVQAEATIKLTQMQLNAFLEAAEPDALIDFLVDNMRDVIPVNIKGSALYELIKDICNIAQMHEVEAFNDKVSLAVAACLTLGKSNQNPKLEKILTLKKWEQGKLGEMLEIAGVI